MVFLLFVTLGAISLLLMGVAVTPRSKKKPIWQWSLDDYGATFVRGVRLMLDAGARNRWRMDSMHKQQFYSERGRMDGNRLPTDKEAHPPEQIPPGAIPPHLRQPGNEIRYRPEDWETSTDDDDLPPTR